MSNLGDAHTFIKFKNEEFDLYIHSFSSTFTLQTAVFYDQGYLPPSVLDAVSHPPSHLFRWHNFGIKVDRSFGAVYLIWNDGVEEMESPDWQAILEEFYIHAQIWREFLDERGQKDLVYVRAM